MSRVLLTGGAGFIGGVVARQLRERGDAVVAVVRDPAKVRRVFDPHGIGIPERDVVARSDLPNAAGVDRGLALYAARRSVLLRQGFNPDDDSPEDTLRNVPPPGWVRIGGNGFYAAYARCS